MTKLEKSFWGLVTIAEIGVVLFWIFGIQGNLKAAGIAFFGAGIAVCIALVLKAIDALRKRNLGYVA